MPQAKLQASLFAIVLLAFGALLVGASYANDLEQDFIQRITSVYNSDASVEELFFLEGIPEDLIEEYRRDIFPLMVKIKNPEITFEKLPDDFHW